MQVCCMWSTKMNSLITPNSSIASHVQRRFSATRVTPPPNLLYCLKTRLPATTWVSSGIPIESAACFLVRQLLRDCCIPVYNSDVHRNVQVCVGRCWLGRLHDWSLLDIRQKLHILASWCSMSVTVSSVELMIGCYSLNAITMLMNVKVTHGDVGAASWASLPGHV